MNYSEQIDAYFDRRMSPEEMEAFEAKVQQDPLLEKEFLFQKEIVDSIKDLRRVELKTRLDSIDVTAIGASTITAGKLISGILIVGGLSIGTWFVIDRSGSESLPEETPVETVEPEVSTPVMDEVEKESEPVAEENVESSEIVADEPVEEAEEVASEEDFELSQPEVIEDIDLAEDNSAVEETPDQPVDLMSSAGTLTEADIEVETRTRRRYPFHYQFESGGLILYGEFDKSPYEILEAKTDSGIELFMFYDKQFYYLDKDKNEVTALEPVKDQELIKQLELLKSK